MPSGILPGENHFSDNKATNAASPTIAGMPITLLPTWSRFILRDTRTTMLTRHGTTSHCAISMKYRKLMDPKVLALVDGNMSRVNRLS
jgi:hypothetical protein